MDTCARALVAAAGMLEDGVLEGPIRERYAGWESPEARRLLAGEYSLADIEERVVKAQTNPRPRSGKQELLENIVNRYL
jgi:xylose isomerase